MKKVKTIYPKINNTERVLRYLIKYGYIITTNMDIKRLDNYICELRKLGMNIETEFGGSRIIGSTYRLISITRYSPVNFEVRKLLRDGLLTNYDTGRIRYVDPTEEKHENDVDTVIGFSWLIWICLAIFCISIYLL